MSSADILPDKNVPRPSPTEWDRECLAWHEAGHAVVSLALPEREPVLRVSIVPGDEAFGIMRVAPRPHHNDTVTSLMSMMAVFLAGPLSERIFLHRATTGGADDLVNARAIARDMVLRFGMGPRLGLLCPALPEAPMSEKLRRAIEKDVATLLRTAQSTAKTVLYQQAPLVRAVAKDLLSQGTLTENNLRLHLAPAIKHR